MDHQEFYLQQLRIALPQLPIQQVQFILNGQYNDVLLVNSELIFRFPKYSVALENLKVETAILSGVQPYLPLAVPAPLYSFLAEREVGAAFLGYRMIASQPLMWEQFTALTPAVQEAVADQLAGFLMALHHIPYQKAFASPLPRLDTFEECQDIFSRIQAKLFPCMRPDACRQVPQYFMDYLSEPGNFAYQAVLKHGDFGTSNILFDPLKQRVTGIIDFGGSGLGDPAYDFAGLLSSYGENFVRRCARVYPEVNDFWGRIRFYQGTFALLEALFGVENNDPEAFASGIEGYR